MARQAAFSQILDVVKNVRDTSIRNIRPQYLINENAVYCHFQQAVLEEWPEPGLIAPLLNAGAYFPGI